jgi:hypothetical protein
VSRRRRVSAMKTQGFPIDAACEAADVSTSAYYGWLDRWAGPTEAEWDEVRKWTGRGRFRARVPKRPRAPVGIGDTAARNVRPVTVQGSSAYAPTHDFGERGPRRGMEAPRTERGALSPGRLAPPGRRGPRGPVARLNGCSGLAIATAENLTERPPERPANGVDTPGLDS